jgi:hypothetical protein
VKGWAERGVPLTLALRGVDRCCERYHAKGPKRRPVRIEFCEADILELFDDWRRAVGVTAGAGARAPVPRKPSLASHIERAIERLLAVRTSAGRSSPFALGLEAVVTRAAANGPPSSIGWPRSTVSSSARRRSISMRAPGSGCAARPTRSWRRLSDACHRRRRPRRSRLRSTGSCAKR